MTNNKRRLLLRKFPRHASQDYIEKNEGVHLLTRIGIARGRCVDLMLEVSHGNLVPIDGERSLHATVERLPIPMANLYVYASALYRRFIHKTHFGLLCRLMAT